MKPNFAKHVLSSVLKDVPEFDPSEVKDSHWLIDSFLAEGSIQLIYGTYGTFKSTAILKAAWAVSRGEDFLGMKSRKRVVLYFDYENPPDVIAGHCRDLGIDLPNPMFTIWDRFHGAQPPVPGDEELDDLVKRCRKQTGRYPWLIFDSWTSLLKSGEGGELIGQVAPIFQALRRLCDVGATCTIIDHSNRSSPKSLYGSGAKMTQMDTMHNFVIQKHSKSLLDECPTAHTVIRVESFLKRYAPQNVGTFSFEVKSEADEDGRWHILSLGSAKDVAVLKLEHQVEGLKNLIKHNPTEGQEELAKLAGKQELMGERRARKLLQEGTGKHWESISRGPRKRVFRVLESPKIPRKNPKR